MHATLISLWMIPLGSVAATLILWGCYAALAHLVHKRKRPDTSEAAQTALTSEQPAGGGVRRAELTVRIAWVLVVITPLVPALFYGTSLFIHDPLPMAMETLVLTAGGGGVLWAYAWYRYRVAVQQLRELQWCREAKAMVVRAVRQVGQTGQTVIHDVKFGSTTIDHLIAGPKGVFAVFTLLTSIPSLSDNASSPIVTYDGWMLQFPHEEDHESIGQADRVTEQFSEWLSERLDLPLSARAILALPGWRIKRISAEGSSVINPTQLTSYFEHVKPRPLGPGAVHQITRLLEQHSAQSDARVGTVTVPTHGVDCL